MSSQQITKFSSLWNMADLPIQVQWSMGNVCNWNCDYCPAYSKAGDKPWPDYDTCLNFLSQLFKHINTLDKPCQVELIGGEVTLHPQFKQLAEYIWANDVHLSIISNGSRTIRFWESVKNYLNHIVISYHPQSMSKEHLINVIDTLNSSDRYCKVTVNISCITGMVEEMVNLRNELYYKWGGLVNLELRVMRDKQGHNRHNGYHYPYTQEEFDLMALPRPWDNQPNPFNPFKDLPEDQQPKNEIKIERADGTITWHTLNEIMINKMNKFTGMYCAIGQESIIVDTSGYIRTGYCQQGYAGHIQDKQINFPTQTVICNQSSCFNLRDLHATKSTHLL